MTQDSFPWGCTPAVGDAGALTVNDLVNAQQFGNNTQPNGGGVVYWTSANPLPGGVVAVNGLLAPSLAGNVVSIATGIGMVQGWNFVNDAVVDFDFGADAGNANATDLIVLERGDPATELTVRLARVKGAASTVATVTQSEALWQVAIAQVELDASGLPDPFSLSGGLIDVRHFLGLPLLFRQGGSATVWGTAGTTNYTAEPITIYSGVVDVTVTAGQTVGTSSITLPRNVHDDKMIVHTSVIIVDLLDAANGAQYASYGAQGLFGTSVIQFYLKRMDNTTLGSDITRRVQWTCLAGQ